MTVKELIEYLQALPQDFQVAYRCCSDARKMETDDICVILASDKKVVQHHNMDDRLRDYNPQHYRPDRPQSPLCPCPGEKPEFVDVVMFPGN